MLLNLPFTKDKKETPKPYFAIELSDELAKVAVWQVDEGLVSVLRTSDIIQIAGTKMDDYLHAVDMAIATVSVETEPDPTEVLYGLPPEWVDTHGVVAQRRSLLKYIGERLELKAIGFVGIQDALIEYLRSKQSTPPSALFIRFRKTHLDIILVNLGKIVRQETVGRSNDVIADVKEGLVRIKSVGQLPPRLILYDGFMDFEDIKQQLMSYNWERDLPFVHTPAIESLSRDATIEAVALVGGAEAAKAITGQKVTDTNLNQEKLVLEQKPTESVSVQPQTKQELPEGFSIGVQTLSQPETVVEPELSKDEEDTFDISKDSENLEQETLSETEIIETFETEKPETAPEKSQFLQKIKSFHLPHFNFKNKEVIKLTDPVEATSDDFFEEKKKRKLPWWSWLLVVLIIFLLTGSGLVWAYFTVPKANINIILKSQLVEKEVTLIVSQEVLDLDEQNFILPGKIASASANGSETVPSTGTKKIGDTAVGKVTIYNKTDNDKTFAKDTILVGPGNLRYVLTESVKVASQSATSTGEGETVTYGKADVAIAAADIGEEYNQSANQNFTFKDLNSDSYIAKNGEAISGGKSTETKAVSKDDRINALDLLTQKLENEALANMQASAGQEKMVLLATKQSEIGDYTFDQKVGDEADSVTITGDIAVQALTVTKSDFDRILLKALAASIPDTYQPTSQGLQSEITEISDAEEGTKLIIKANVKILPKMDFEQIKQAIRGKKLNIADQYLHNLPNYQSSEIILSPKLPDSIILLPRNTAKIAVNITESE